MTLSERTAVASHIAVAVLSLTVAVCAVVGTVAGLRTLDGMNAAIATVNQPCAPGPCGTLAALTKATTKAGDAVVQTQLTERAVGQNVMSTLNSLAKVGPHLSQTADALSQTASSASTAIQGVQSRLTPVLDSSKATLDAATERINGLADSQRLLNMSLTDLDAQVKNPDIPRLLSGLATTSQNVGGITGDLRKVADKTTADYLKPVPWYLWPVKRGGELMDLGAAVARHTP